jgi:predicted membrane channel-forming protein YqfA (hemolysin III family)
VGRQHCALHHHHGHGVAVHWAVIARAVETRNLLGMLILMCVWLSCGHELFGAPPHWYALTSACRIFSSFRFVLYGVGFGFYASHVPQRCAPRRFDVFLGSHQIVRALARRTRWGDCALACNRVAGLQWHVFVAAAAGVWIRALVSYVRLRNSTPNYCDASA